VKLARPAIRVDARRFARPTNVHHRADVALHRARLRGAPVCGFAALRATAGSPACGRLQESRPFGRDLDFQF
jgi:hypothetical protein